MTQPRFTLLDRLKQFTPPEAKLAKQTRETVSFVCTDEFAKLVSKASLLPPAKLLTLAQHATPPANAMLIEWRYAARVEGLVEQGAPVMGHSPEYPPPGRVGFWILNHEDQLTTYNIITDEVNNSGRMLNGKLNILAPIGYSSGPHARHDHLAAAGITAEHMLTTTYLNKYEHDKVLRELMLYLQEHYYGFWAGAFGEKIMKWGPDVQRMARLEHGGDVRWLVALLGLLNLFDRKEGEQRYAGTGERKTINRGKVVQRSPYREISIVVPGTKIPIEYVTHGLRAAVKRRDHGVRKHLRHYKSGLVVEVKAHRRGDTKLGTVQQVYVVRTEKGQHP